METYAKSLSQSYEVMDIANFARVEGRKEGRMEGRKEGKMEGRVEGRVEVAHKLLQRGMSIEEILPLTNLTREQIQKLLKH